MGELKAVVTGMGMASAIGLEEDEVWEALKDGKSGIREWPGYEYRGSGIPVGACDLARIKEYLAAHGVEIPTPEQRAITLALYVVHRALSQSPPLKKGQKRALYVGSSLTTNEILSARYGVYFSGGRNPASSIIEGANCYFAACISQAFGISGPVVTISSSCASSIQAIAYATQDLMSGKVDEAIVVGVDSAMTKPMFDTWMSARILSRLSPFETAARPFCRTRRGFVYAEGAGCVVLRRRGEEGKIAILGYDFNASPGVLISLEVSDMARTMSGALKEAGVGKEEIGFIHANANGSRPGDLDEAKAINSVLGNKINVYTSKSLYGNAHGAAGIINLIHSYLIFQHQFCPANAHIVEADPEIEGLINCYYSSERSFNPRYGLINTFGFGGMNASIVFGLL
ncbi:MAG TPA: beta-ketoacyl synthase N-terminal-like domain-containing protein [Syntrophales bacterium]|nr:beta-ketoacyl synthase N-terminal-like domain-containing protein [Syntrophales bacterium]HOL58598.1 beta-ketoacyl synthase N-terminal-like domain-containing protein [Syntrophales bacterium]HPO34794.1 beta-ketoacyl synthase N-terminal-like domain-containing protein [Syntrophales bacterium]